MRAIKLVYFSPTGTSASVVQAIAQGINSNSVEIIDITKPETRKQPFQTSPQDLLIIGVPVYMGRVPALLDEWFDSIRLHDTPTICVVVYGNRVYDDALLELSDNIKKRGGIPIAGGAYIGEHSFSNSETPSLGRPDQEDLGHATSFGEKILEKLESLSSISEMPELAIPGTYPYGGITELWNVDFIEVAEQCTQCGLCSEVCPVGAVSPQDSSAIDHEKCVTCCACIKKCPQQARAIKAGQVKAAQERINTLTERKLSENYL